MKPSDKFRIVERELGQVPLYGMPVSYYTVYDIKRVRDDKTIATKTDYLEALKYLEALEDRSWLVS